jgi:hypothetical protein
MSEPDASFASEPITPRGMVAFAHARVGRLWIVQLLAAILVAVSVLWFFNDSCVPAIAKALRNLSGTGEIHSGELAWRGDSPKVLAEERFLAFDLDLNHTGRIHCTSDLQIEFGRDSIRVFSLFGSVDFYYPYNPPDQIIPVSRDDLEPLWGAWLVEIQAIMLAVIVIGLLLLWNILATLYWLPVWMLGFLTSRDLSLGQSWRLAGASLLPGSLLLALGVFLYDFAVLDLIQFGFVVCAHLLLGWIYLFVGLLFLPHHAPQPARKNPFEPGK